MVLAQNQRGRIQWLRKVTGVGSGLVGTESHRVKSQHAHATFIVGTESVRNEVGPQLSDLRIRGLKLLPNIAVASVNQKSPVLRSAFGEGGCNL